MKIKLSHSFSTRLSLNIILITGIVFTVAFVCFYYLSRRQVQIEAEKSAAASLENTVLRIDELLHSVEVAVKNNSGEINRQANNPDSMFRITRRLLETNPFIVGSAIAFEPDYFSQKGRHFSPYAFRQGDTIRDKQLGTDDYEYHYMDWYQIPKLLEKPYWSEPYFDDGGSDIMVTTYSLPLYDNQGRFYGVFTADLSLEWLTNEVNSMKLYPNSYNLMIGCSGVYLTHPKSERIFNETIFTAAEERKDTTLANAGHQMIEGKRGFATLYNNGDASNYYLFYAPVSRSGWSVAVACTYSDIFAGVDKIRAVVLSIAVAGLILLLVFCLYTIRKLIRPLTNLANATETIAKGDLTVPLPPMKMRNDEMGTLCESFENMRQSLTAYMEDLAITTAKKERIESELHIAKSIQMGLVPHTFSPFPEWEGLELFAMLRSAKEVGGDLYDFFIRDARLFFTIGDVSGKGVPASLFMAVTRTLFRMSAGITDSPKEIVRTINDTIVKDNDECMFVTMFVGVLDLKTAEMRFCNAGHNLAVITDRTGSRFMKEAENIPIGVMDEYEYTEQSLQLDDEQTLLLYTDGITEAENSNRELFGDKRLLSLLSEHADDTPRQHIERLAEAVEAFAVGMEQSDDLTMLSFRLRKSENPIE